jgi:predicted RNA-binding protein with PUA domain
MEKKRTAVEKLELMLLGMVSFDSEELRLKYKKAFEKAKEMEKQQIIDANNQEICSHPDKEFVPGVFGGYWCSKCNRNVDSELEQD